MVYAIISEKDNQTSLAYFKSKKIPQGNYVRVSSLQLLAQKLSAGDVIYVVGIDRFSSVGVWQILLCLQLQLVVSPLPLCLHRMPYVCFFVFGCVLLPLWGKNQKQGKIRLWMKVRISTVFGTMAETGAF